MTPAQILRSLVLALAILSARLAAADPIDYSYGIITGADIIGRSGTIGQGLPIGIPVWDWIDNKRYTYQVAPSGNERDESYVGFGPTRDFGFSSALVTAGGALEVGVTDPTRSLLAQRAVSRYNATIKNNTDQPLATGMDFYIPRGVLELNGIRSDHTAHLRVEALIDYVLLTPAGPFGGHYDETTGNLFSYYADVQFDNRLTHSANANVTLVERNDSVLRYLIDPFNGHVSFPDVPAHGELQIFYDMYAHMNIQRFEIGGYAMLGDPLDLVVGPGIRMTSEPEPSIPEPATLVLMAAGLVAVVRRRRTVVTRRFNSRVQSSH